MIWAILLAILAYGKVYQGGLVSDDKSTIGNGRVSKTTLWGFPSHSLDNFWFRTIKRNTRAWHLVTLGYHLLTICAFYLLVNKLFGQDIATIASLLFAIHPATNQGAAWISGRNYALTGLFTVIAFLYADNPLILLTFFVLAFFTHPQGAMLPLILMIYRPSALNMGCLAILLIGASLYYRIAKERVGIFGWELKESLFTPKRLNMIVKVLSYYFYVALIPFKLGFYHQKMFAYDKRWDKFNIETVLGVIILGTLGSLAFVFRTALPSFSLGIAWYFIFLIPCINIIHSNMIFAERYMYIPLMGFVLSIASLLNLMSCGHIVLASVLTLYCVKTITVVLSYIDEYTLYATNIRQHPESVEAHINYGDILIKDRRPDLAYPVLNRAVDIEPGNEIAWFNFGCAKANLGDIKGAEDCWLEAIKLNPKYVNPRYNLMRLRDEAKKNNWQTVAVGVKG